MRCAVLLLVLGSFTEAPADEGAKLKDKEQRALQGRWMLISYERDGKKVVPPDDSQLTIDGPTWTVSTSTTRQPGRFRIDPSQSPKALDRIVKLRDLFENDGVTPSREKNQGEKETTTKCIYDVGRDRLDICMASSTREGADDRPKGFRGTVGYTLLVYVRVK